MSSLERLFKCTTCCNDICSHIAGELDSLTITNENLRQALIYNVKKVDDKEEKLQYKYDNLRYEVSEYKNALNKIAKGDMLNNSQLRTIANDVLISLLNWTESNAAH